MMLVKVANKVAGEVEYANGKWIAHCINWNKYGSPLYLGAFPTIDNAINAVKKQTRLDKKAAR